jgi:hypothetical protein
MFLILVLAIVGGVSVAVAHTIQHGTSRRQLAEMSHGTTSPSMRAAKFTLVTVSLTLAVFLPLLVVAYVAIGLVRRALGQ